MIKHGASHGLAYLVSTVAAGLLVGVLGSYLPGLLDLLDAMTARLVARYDITMFDQEQLDILLLAMVLTTIWGMGFRFMHSDRRE